MQTTLQLSLTILIIAVATLLTRAVPFILFPGDKKTPQIISYLGTALPYACMAMLVIYCFKGVNFLKGAHGIPAVIASALVIALHKWKHNLLLSILGGTAVYMILLHVIGV